MKVGLTLGDPGDVTEEARMAEDLGYDYVTSGEHLFFHGAVPNGFVSLAAAAGATKHIRLVSTISLAPLYPAALLAKLAASLDVVSGGRFELGLGAGGEHPPEFEAVGVDPASRFRRLAEAVEVCRRLFSGDVVDFEGEFTHLSASRLDPPPTQRPGPPIWLVGRRSPTLRRVGRHADVWLPYMVTPDRLAAGLTEIRAAAVEAGRPEGAVDGAVFAWTCTDADGAWARSTGIDAVSRTYAQDFAPLADRYLFLGTPDQIVARLREFAGAGADRVVIALAAPPPRRRAMIRTIADQVLPGVAEL